MSFYAEVETQSKERVALEPGSYFSGKEAGLRILSHFEPRNDKNGRPEHSFLVAATRSSREQIQKKAESNGHEDVPFGDIIPPGTAFLKITLDELWLQPEAIALAFTEASRNKDGDIQKDYIAAAIKHGDATEESIRNCKMAIQRLAKDKVVGANTPAEKMEEAFNAQYLKELQQISIKIGQFFALQDWKNKGNKSKRNPGLDPAELVGSEFSGKVEHDSFGPGGSKVTSVYSCSLGK